MGFFEHYTHYGELYSQRGEGGKDTWVQHRKIWVRVESRLYLTADRPLLFAEQLLLTLPGCLLLLRQSHLERKGAIEPVEGWRQLISRQ